MDTRVCGGKRYDYWKMSIAAMNAAFHNVKWVEVETKGVSKRWKCLKLRIEEKVKKVPLRERKKPDSKAPW